MSQARAPFAPERIVIPGVLVLGAALAVACLLAAGRAWFSEDDFRWLSVVRAPDFSMASVWFPIEERDWWSWRPLAMHTYFFVNQKLFGMEPMGFYVVSLTVHWLRAPLVYLLATRLGIPVPVAAATALLAVSRPPSVDVVLWASAFSYFAVSALSLAALVCFVDALTGDLRRRIGSVLALVLALLCQESAVVLPGVMVVIAMVWNPSATSPAEARARWSFRTSALRAARTTWPHWLVVGLYSAYRFVVIAEVPRRANYESVWGLNVLANAAQYLEWIAGGAIALALAGGILALGLAAGLRGRGASGRAARQWGPACAVLVVFAVAEVLPFVPVRSIAPRFAIALEVPVVLLLGLALGVLWCESGGRRVMAPALLLLCLVAAPYRTLSEAYALPRGAAARHVAQRLVLEAAEPVGAGEHIVVLSPAGAGSAWAIRRETWTGTPMLGALLPGALATMAFVGEDGRIAPADLGPTARYFVLDQALGLRAANGHERRRFYERALESDRLAIASPAAARLAILEGPDAKDRIVRVAESAGPEGAAIARALLLIDSAHVEAEAARWFPDADERRRTAWALRASWLGERRPGPVPQKKPPSVRE